MTAEKRDVVIIGPVPTQSFDVAPAVAKHIAWGTRLPHPQTVQGFKENQRPVLSLLSGLEALDNVRVVYPHLLLCDGTTCPYSIDGKPLYSDEAHLTPHGVAKLSRMFDEIFDEAATSQAAELRTSR